MKNIRAVLFFVFVLIAMIGMITSQSMAQMVNIKVRCNTSTCLDTLRPTHTVRLLGESTSPTVPPMSWTSSSGIVLTNVGGDYWETTFQAPAGDTVKYKFWTGFTGTAGTSHWGGWDGPIDAGIPSGDNRMLLVGSSDTTLPLQYFNGWDTKVLQYWRPFESKTDSVAVYFRVNMGGATFDPATQVVDVRGGLPMGADNPWIRIKQLVREINSVNNGSFWSGVAYVAKSLITPGTTQQKFKFVIQPEIWENVGDRSFTFSSTNDTTILWYYFNDVPPGAVRINADILFVLRLDALEKANMFNRALGDKVAVTGAKGWPPPSGFVFDTEPTMLKMTYDPGAKEWDRVEPFSKYAGEAITYKYYIAWDSTRVDTLSPNYIPGLRLTDGWEEPGVTGGADRSYTYGTTTPQTVPGDFGSDVQFFNSLHWKGAIRNPIQVVFNIDMAPAANVATNPNVLFRPGIDTAYIQFDGCMVPITQGKTMWGTDNRLMLSDPDGDGIYTATDTLRPPTFYQFCYRVVYRSGTAEVENGSGSALRGRRYYQYVHPTQVTADSAVWPSTYSLAQMSWKLDNLTIEDPPNLDQVSGVGNEGQEPLSYALRQNYPNPFNPSTVITYSIPKEAHVKIEVYSILGQKVASLFDQAQTAGVHSIAWNAQGAHGQKLSSGVYILRMQSGSFSQVRKMMLVR